MNFVLFSFPISCISIILVIYLTFKWFHLKYDYFLKKNVIHKQPVPFFGSYMNLILQRQSFAAILCDQYEKFKHKSYFGTFFFRVPVIVVTDPTLIRSITITDFDSFTDHSSYMSDSSLIELALTNMKGEKWRSMRATLAPVFERENIRRMFYLIEESCLLAMQSLKESKDATASFEVDLKDLSRRFALDTIASLTLGIKPNALLSKNCEFHRKTMKMFEMTPALLFKLSLYGNFPKLMKFFKIPILDSGFLRYFYSLVHETIKFRQTHNIQHYDMIHLLMQQHIQQGSHDPKYDCTNLPPNDEVIAQCLLFVFGGLTKITDQLSWIILELAVNPAAQENLLREIRKAQIPNNKLTFETLNSLHYLDMIIYETVRKWPIQGMLERKCVKPYCLNDRSNEHCLDVNPGDSVWIPVISLHNDPLYFPEPDKFLPERFNEDKRGFIKPYAFLPFGCGPRNCLGAKLAITLLKAAVCSFSTNFLIEPEIEGMKRVKLSNKGWLIQPESYKVRLKPRT